MTGALHIKGDMCAGRLTSMRTPSLLITVAWTARYQQQAFVWYTEEEIFKMVLKSDLDFKTAPWPNVSEEAKDCVRQLLNRNVSQRITAAQVLQHPWLTRQGLQSDKPLGNVVIERMKQVGPQLP